MNAMFSTGRFMMIYDTERDFFYVFRIPYKHPLDCIMFSKINKNMSRLTIRC